MTTQTRPARNFLTPLGWAAFLAVSWTWCIGMFLPVLLVRDYGTLGWVIFAVPNVVGAAAMGWVLKTRESSERMVSRHAAAAVCFSVATILFHVLFAAAVIPKLLGPAGVVLTAGAAVGFWAAMTYVGTARLIAAAAVLALSIAAFVYTVVDAGPQSLAGSADPTSDVFWLALVCLYGFLLCPYLDLTFHRARQATTQFGAIGAFTIGFGVLFLLMIVFTLWYAPIFASTSPLTINDSISQTARWAVGGHMALQTGFTVAAHAAEVREQWRTGRHDVRQGAWVGAALGAVALAAGLLIATGGRYRGLGSFELSYRIFMSFYALLAPAYVWLCVVPAPRGALIPAARHFAVFLIAATLAAPMFWMGFIERRMLWIGPGLAVLLLGRLALVGGHKVRVA